GKSSGSAGPRLANLPAPASEGRHQRRRETPNPQVASKERAMSVPIQRQQSLDHGLCVPRAAYPREHGATLKDSRGRHRTQAPPRIGGGGGWNPQTNPTCAVFGCGARSPLDEAGLLVAENVRYRKD